MEQARMFLAIILSLLVFIVWNYYFVEKPDVSNPDKNNPSTQQALEDIEKEPLHVEKTYTPKPETEPSSPEPLPVEENTRVITVSNTLYEAEISEKLGGFQSFKLRKYKETLDNNSDLKELITDINHIGAVTLDFSNNAVPGLSHAVFHADQTSDTLMLSGSSRTLSLTWASPEGIIVEKKYTFYPDSYLIDLDVIIKNGSDHALTEDLRLSLVSKIPENSARYGFEGPGALLGNSFKKIEYDDVEEENQFKGKLEWISIQSRYFLRAIIPNVRTEAIFNLEKDKNEILKAGYVFASGDIQPRIEKAFKFSLFMGPKSVNLLKTYGYHLDKAVDFGFFDFIAKPCLWLMNKFYSFFPNYGVAIIILTILIKILFWPLGNKSYKSMNEMKKLQPLMADIREKYKDDKKRMNEEVMNLYKTYKVNPVGGCLPMIAQIPVFFALYQMLYSAIELRHAPFFGWINDLSAPDRLFHFNITVPFMHPPYGIPVLTIVMGATMLIQQKLQPPPGDPAQAKMMMFMPIIFTVIFINFSSGLVLYWLINNILSLAQQYYVSKAKD